MKQAFFAVILLYLIPTGALAAVGSIDTSYPSNQAKVCYDATCTTPSPSIINFALDQEPSIVIDSVNGISGQVWGDKLGWITLDPEGAGVFFANSTTGVLTGKAWSQVSGWINFAPTGQQVRINPATGEFEGWAWAGGVNGGWIKFDCTDSTACVHTTWRIATSSSSGGTSGGIRPTGAPVVDTCSNIAGIQDTPPAGLYRDVTGACVPLTVDYCPNIDGVQSSVPKNMIVTAFGICAAYPKDVCPKDLGIQTSYDDCRKPVLDSCLNLTGVQVDIPEGYEQSGDSCYPPAIDFCPNIDGAQSAIPVGLTIGSDGSCILAMLDVCPNISGIQENVPDTFIKNDVDCVMKNIPIEQVSVDDTPHVMALSFIPPRIQIPSDNNAVKSVVDIFDRLLGKTRTSGPYKVDIISGGIVVVFGILGITALIGIFRFIRRFFV